MEVFDDVICERPLIAYWRYGFVKSIHGQNVTRELLSYIFKWCFIQMVFSLPIRLKNNISVPELDFLYQTVPWYNI